MTDLTPQHMSAFVDQLQKEAGGFTGMTKSLWGNHMAGRYGRQLLGGAGIGAGIGALQANPDDRLRGAIRGAAIGGGLTGGAQLLTHGGRAALADTASKTWERARYQATGRGLSKGGYGVRTLSDGKPGSISEYRNARRLGLVSAPPKLTAEVRNNPELLAKALPGHEKALARHQLERESLSKGWMSVPGAAHGMLTEPGKMVSNAWGRLATPWKVLTGVGALGVGKEAITPTQPGGPGRAERTLGTAASTLGYLVAPPGLAASYVGGEAVGKAGSKIGKGIDTVAGHLLHRNQMPAQEIQNV